MNMHTYSVPESDVTVCGGGRFQSPNPCCVRSRRSTDQVYKEALYICVFLHQILTSCGQMPCMQSKFLKDLIVVFHKIVFSLLGGAVMLLVYEYTYGWFQEHW